MNKEVEKFIKKYGEEYRILIEHSLMWLTEQEPKWQLDKPIDKKEFIADLVSRSYPIAKTTPCE